MNVVVPLDNPEASSFIRSAPPGSTQLQKKRKKDVNDKLEASDEYTQAKFGNDFPGQEVRVGGEDPFNLQRLEMMLNHHHKVKMKLKNHL